MTTSLNYKERFILQRFLRLSNPETIEWDVPDFPEQNNFVNSTAFRVAAQCPRRSGKSYAIGLKIVKTSYIYPNSNVIYLALTRDSAERIIYKDILKEIFDDKKIKVKSNSTKLTYTLSNGSVIKLAGADQSDKEMEKLLGGKYKLAAIDEAAFFKQNLKKLIQEMLEPGLIDLGGQIYVISTTSHNVHSYYFDIVNERVKEKWDIHKWTSLNNPFIAKNYKEAVDRMLTENPDIVKEPGFRRMYLNEWVIDKDLQVYRFNNSCLIPELPQLGNRAKWFFGLGIDLGWEDSNAFVVTCWNKFDPTLYILAKKQQNKMDFIDVAEYVEKLIKHYGNFEFMVIDGANKQGVETMRRRHKLPFVAAEKTGKRDFIELFNSEMNKNKIKIVTKHMFKPGEFNNGKEYEDELVNEMSSLVWDEKLKEKGIYEELASCPNHLCDAMLYNWRHSFNFTNISLPKLKPEYGSDEHAYQEMARIHKRSDPMGFDDLSVYDRESEY